MACVQFGWTDPLIERTNEHKTGTTPTSGKLPALGISKIKKKNTQALALTHHLLCDILKKD